VSAPRLDDVVVGAGPNGLAAAVTLARAGRRVLLVEAADRTGGGLRSDELTASGFRHDWCATVHAMGRASPFLRSVDLAARGVDLLAPEVPLAHPLDGGRVAVLEREVAATAAGLGRDGAAYRRLVGPLARRAQELVEAVVGPPPFMPHLPRHLAVLTAFAARGAWPTTVLGRSLFRGQLAPALLGGLGAHAVRPLERPPTAAVGLLLGALAHAHGWPFVRGGSQNLADALVAEFTALGGDVLTGHRVDDVDRLPAAEHVLLDLTPRQVLAVAGHRFPARYRSRLARYRYGAGVFKIDWALDGPVPWTAERVARAGTVHLGGTLEEVAAAERDVARGRVPHRPFVLLAQATVVDRSRAPAGGHTLWGYCHVPHGCTVDMTAAVESQIERFAPGFRDRVLARRSHGPRDMERHDANYVGGDIGGGAQDLRQLFTRPVARYPPYSTPDPAIWMCSSSTPPGGGVHGMCGASAADAVLRRVPGRTAAGHPRRPPV
jgi:phytoene dehydrogenase-like protein